LGDWQAKQMIDFMKKYLGQNSIIGLTKLDYHCPLNIFYKRKYCIEKIAVFFILSAGVVLSLLQFLYNRSLWLDESCLALNIIHKNSFELLKPLDYNQVAPILFLQIEKLFSTILPHSEYGLRLFPLLCFWASIYFFYKIIKMQMSNIYAIIFGLSLFVFNNTLFYYSNEVKQYMTDVFVLLSVFYFVQKDYNKEKNKFYVLGIIGTIAIFLSNVAPIILFTCGIYLMYDDFFVTKRRKLLSLFIVFVVWLSVFSLYYYFFIYEHPTSEFMIYYWSGKEVGITAFLPHNSIRLFGAFLFTKAYMIQNMLSPSRIIIFISLVIGIVDLIKQRKIHTIILVCTPVLLHLFLSTFQLYPFEVRLILYTLPCIIIICSIGFSKIITIIFIDLRIKRFSILAIFVPVFFLFSLVEFPMKKEEIKKGIKYMQENIDEKENIYIGHGAQYSFKYYNDIGFANIKTQINYAEKNINDNEIRNLHGKNWLLFSTIFAEEERLIINRLDSMGCKKIKEFKDKGVATYLYDFGE
jgi:hypothetical protein